MLEIKNDFSEFDPEPMVGFVKNETVRLYLHPKESLINSESFSCAGKMCQIKAPIAGMAQSNRCSQSIRFAHGLSPAHGASFSMAIAKIGNAELAHFNKQMLIHELIRGSLSN